jgi:hypothetical protein
MSVLNVSSPRGTAHLEIRILRREGSAYGVAVLVNTKLVEIIHPEGFANLVKWLRENATQVEAIAKQTGDEEG